MILPDYVFDMDTLSAGEYIARNAIAYVMGFGAGVVGSSLGTEKQRKQKSREYDLGLSSAVIAISDIIGLCTETPMKDVFGEDLGFFVGFYHGLRIGGRPARKH